MRILFTKEKNQQGGTSTTERAGDILKPKTTSINIIEEFPWTLTPKTSLALKETPYIKLNEYYLLDGALNQLLQAYQQSPISTSTNFRTVQDIGFLLTTGNLLQSAAQSNRVYENFYDHKNRTGFSYKFPYFENPSTTQNNWAARSSYDAMLQLQRTLAQVQATVTYYNRVNTNTNFLNSISVDDWLQAAEGALTGQDLNPLTNEAISRELAAQLGERGLNVAGLIGGGAIVGEGFQRIRRLMVDLNVFSVDFFRTLEQIQIALDSATGNIGADPVLDKPHIWNSSTPRTFNISFPLYNINPTEGSNWQKTIIKNWELCYLLTYQNLYNKRNLFKGIPPVFYSVEVPGVYYTKASYVSNLIILNIGNIRKMTLPVADNNQNMSVNVPDAYVVNMTLTDFFMPSRNFLDTVNNKERRRVVTKSG
jgi:hypothetical protein